MVKLSVNLDEVETKDFEIIPAGEYTAKVMEIIEGDSSSGNPMLTWSWEVTSGPNQGANLKSYTSLQDHALFGLKEHLAAFGIEGNLEGLETDSIIGKVAKLKVSKNVIPNRDSGEDMDVNRVNKVLPATAKAATPAKTLNKDKIPL